MTMLDRGHVRDGLIVRSYGVLLRLLPREFRHRYGGAMTETFRDRLANARRRNAAAIAGCVVREAFDLLKTATTEWWLAHTRPNRPRSVPHSTFFWRESVDRIALDVRLALRSLLKRPAFSLIVIGTLALPIGANTAIFSLANGILIRPLPYPEPDRLAVMWGMDFTRGGTRSRVAAPNARDVATNSSSFEQLGILGNGLSRFTPEDADPEMVTTGMISADYFDALGIAPMLGRTFRAEENHSGGPAVVMVSEGFWRHDLAATPNVIGHTIVLDDTAHTIVGVVPSVPVPIDVPTSAQLSLSYEPRVIWKPLDYDRGCASNRGCQTYAAIGRMRDGVSIAEAQSEVDVVAGALAAELGIAGQRGMRLVSMHREVAGNIRPGLFVLLGAVGLVLLMACANLVNLFLTRAAAQQRDLAVRSALGASRWRLAGQLITESTILALIGGLLGFALTHVSIDAVLSLYANDVPRRQEIAVNGWVLAFNLVISISTGLLIGALPALHASRSDARAALSIDSRSSTGARRSRIVRSALIVAEMALVMVLAVGAGLLAKSFAKLLQVETGFEGDGVAVASFVLPPSLYQESDQLSAFTNRLETELRAAPGITSVAVAYDHPLTATWIGGFTVEGETDPGGPSQGSGRYRPVGPGYFETLGITVLEGREFTSRDRRTSPGVVVVNETLAKNFLGDQPIGKRLGIAQSQMMWGPEMPASFEVVGVARDVKFMGVDAAVEPAFYIPWSQGPYWVVNLFVRTEHPVPSLGEEIRDAARRLDAGVPAPTLTTMDELYVGSLASPRFTMLLFGGFGALALALAVIGVYGVVSYTTAQRTREVGIRIALGATPQGVVGTVLRHGVGVVTVGLTIGLVTALLSSRVLAALLFGVTTSDPTVFAGVTVVLLGVGAAAVYLPARRASRVDPAEALRG